MRLSVPATSRRPTRRGRPTASSGPDPASGPAPRRGPARRRVTRSRTKGGRLLDAVHRGRLGLMNHRLRRAGDRGVLLTTSCPAIRAQASTGRTRTAGPQVRGGPRPPSSATTLLPSIRPYVALLASRGPGHPVFHPTGPCSPTSTVASPLLDAARPRRHADHVVMRSVCLGASAYGTGA